MSVSAKSVNAEHSDSFDDDDDDECDENHYNIKLPTLRKLVSELKSSNQNMPLDIPIDPYFVEDTINFNDVTIDVTNFGRLTLPITCECGEQLMNIARFSDFSLSEHNEKDQSTLYVIPGDKLNVKISNIKDILSCIQKKLRLNENSNLKAHLGNLTIYNEGQCFDYHKETANMANVVAVLIISLPSLHIGGDVIIKSFDKSHVFSTETVVANLIKYSAFYSECLCKGDMIRQGSQFMLKYNLTLDKQECLPKIIYQENLLNIIKGYFKVKPKLPKTSQRYYKYGECKDIRKLVLLFDNIYDKKFRFDNLTGTDIQTGLVLVSIAKKLNIRAYFALADVKESWRIDGKLYGVTITLQSWYDVDGDTLSFRDFEVDVKEVCWLKHNNRFKPYDVYRDFDGGVDRSFRRGAIVLWPRACDQKMRFTLDYRQEMLKLHSILQTQRALKSTKVNLIMRDVKERLFGDSQPKYTNPLYEVLVELAIHLNDHHKALDICVHCCANIFSSDDTNKVFDKLKKAFGSSWCLVLLIKSGLTRDRFSEKLVKFVYQLKEYGEETMIDHILRDQIDASGRPTEYSIDNKIDKYGHIIKAAYDIGRLNFVHKILKTALSGSWSSEEIAEFYLNYAKHLEIKEVRDLRQVTINHLNRDIDFYKVLVKRTDWAILDVSFPSCGCFECREVVEFLKSGTKSLEYTMNIEYCDHIKQTFTFSPLYMITTQNRGRRSVLVIDKRHEVKLAPRRKLAKLEELLKIIECDGKTSSSVGPCVDVTNVSQPVGSPSVKEQGTPVTGAGGENCGGTTLHQNKRSGDSAPNRDDVAKKPCLDQIFFSI